MDVKNYVCPNCGGPIRFDASEGKVVCEYCDSRFEPSYIEEIMRPDEPDGEVNSSPEIDEAILAGGERAEDSGEWDISGATTDWGDDAGNLATFNCPSCGAGLIVESITGATSCPFCGNPTVISAKFEGVLKPEFIIPFKIKQDQAEQILANHYKKKPLLPKSFKSGNRIKELKAVYVPFWLTAAETDGNARFKAIRETVVETPNERIITKHHYDVYREGNMAFDKVPADASRKMPDDVMDSLEPFDYSELTPFNISYLAGSIADRYDVSAEETASRSELRCRNTFMNSLRSTVVGYNSVIVTGSNVSVKRGRVHYALLPVYMLRTEWNGQEFIFAINGQTGKPVGNLVIDKGKAVLFGLISFAAAAVVTMLIGGFFM